jgi:hypothetical protein
MCFKFSLLCFIYNNIPATTAYGVYISQLIRYSRACSSYQDFLDRGLLLTMKLLNQGFLLVKLKSSLRCSGRVNSSCSTTDTHRVNLVTNPVINHERGKDREVYTCGLYPWSSVTQIFHNGQPSHGGDRNTNCLPFRSTWVHLRLLVGFVLLDL